MSKRYQVPQGSNRACLCRDGSYSIDCCNSDDYFSEGIGSITMGASDSAGTITQINTTRTLTTTSG